jgi:hypothetical protein
MNTMKAFLGLVWLMFALAMCGNAQAGDYSPPKFQGRTGNIYFTNDSPNSVTVWLWHPDNGERFASWDSRRGATSRLYYNGAPIVVGDDWGVQLGDSKIRPLSDFARWDNSAQVFTVSVDSFNK